MNPLEHSIILPIVAPLIGAALTLLTAEKWRRHITLGTVLLVAGASFGLLWASSTASDAHFGEAHVYRLGDWPAAFAIVLVSDRLSALMLVLTSALAVAALTFSFARWDHAGPRFHALFLLLMMGLNGAFLTGDLFNLFVFFEVLLAASYGLLLHGSGAPRVKAGLHYIAINLAASSLFLLGVGMIYGVAGTLNMASIGAAIANLSPEDRALFEGGCALLGIAFLVKAGMWPLGFWLPGAYSAASAPAAAMFAIMTKVGAYVVLRLSMLWFGPEAQASAGFGAPWLLIGGVATILFGAVGAFATPAMSRIAGFCVLMSSGALLAVIGAGAERALPGALYYLVASTLAASAFFLLIELINRARGTTAPAESEPVFDDEFLDPYKDDAQEVRFLIPATIGLLSGAFLLSTLLLAGMPPLPTFIGKFAIIAGLMPETGNAPFSTWVLIGALTFSSLATLLALTRIGIEVFWASTLSPPQMRAPEGAAIGGLLAACLLLTVFGGPATRYLAATAAWLTSPGDYIQAVLIAPPTAPSAEAAP